MAKMIFIFLDGVGVGSDSRTNPFYAAKCRFLPFFPSSLTLPDGTPVKAIDCLLEVHGTPQSATGQTTLFTGINAAKIWQEHQGSFPNKRLRQLILICNILSQLTGQKTKSVFINAFPVYSRFFRPPHIKLSANGQFDFSSQFPDRFKRRISVTTCMMIAAGQKPFSEKDISGRRSIYQDFTNRLLISRGLDMPLFSPAEAAEILHHALQEYDFILYEYFQTDIYGHRKSSTEAIELVHELDQFTGEIISRLDPESECLVITSDHGNIEDISTPLHTLNPVPFICWGHKSQTLRKNIFSLTDVFPAIVNYFFLE